MRYKVLMMVLLSMAPVVVQGQSGGLDPRTLAAIEEALRTLAMRNHSVEHLIYDGMTVQDVERILGGMVYIVWDAFWFNQGFEDRFTNVSRHGNYVVFWSGGSRYSSVVIGYARDRDPTIYHNQVDGPKLRRIVGNRK